MTTELGSYGAFRIVGIIAARCSSARLPGKVLRSLQGRPLLLHLVERLRSIELIDEVVIATSTEPSDDPIAAWAEATGVSCWRGSLMDVLGRIRGAGASRGANAVVRISGDSPLLDPTLVRRAICLFFEHKPDLVTNVFPRSFPKGQSVEVLSRAALDRLDQEARNASDREHVTAYAYAHPERFKICNFVADQQKQELQLSVDTQEDFDRASMLLAAYSRRTPTFPSVDTLIELAATLAPSP